MNKIILAALAVAAVAAHARLTVEKVDDVKTVYITEAGDQVSAIGAAKAASAGQTVFQCKPVEVKETKSGISFRAKRN